jgi:hypothetical protein
LRKCEGNAAISVLDMLKLQMQIPIFDYDCSAIAIDIGISHLQSAEFMNIRASGQSSLTANRHFH